MAESDRLLSDCTPFKGVPRVRIPLSPPLDAKKILRPWLSWIERQTTNLNVAGSNLAGRTNKNKGLGKTLNPLFISLLPYWEHFS